MTNIIVPFSNLANAPKSYRGHPRALRSRSRASSQSRLRNAIHKRPQTRPRPKEQLCGYCTMGTYFSVLMTTVRTNCCLRVGVTSAKIMYLLMKGLRLNWKGQSCLCQKRWRCWVMQTNEYCRILSQLWCKFVCQLYQAKRKASFKTSVARSTNISCVSLPIEVEEAQKQLSISGAVIRETFMQICNQRVV